MRSYWHTLQAMYSDENGIQFAQSMIYNYQQEQLFRLGYHFYIEKNGYEVFSNLTDEDKYVATSVAGEAVAHAKTLTASSYDISVIKNTFHHGDHTFCIVAVHQGETDQSVISYVRRYIFTYLLAFAGLFIALQHIHYGGNCWGCFLSQI